MTGEHTIDYEILAQEALRGIVRTVLTRVAKTGLPGEHHFYIAFDTNAAGVTISPRLKERYPQEMTIVLQHRFRDLIVTDKRFEVGLSFDGIAERLVVPFAAIKVFFDPSVPYGLQFDGSGVTVDAERDLPSETTDGLTLEPGLGAARTRLREVQDQSPPANRAEKKPRAARKPRSVKGETGSEAPKPRAISPAVAEPNGGPKENRPKGVTTKLDQHDAPANDTKIIQLDKFRKK
jgi:uncharacterized protein